MIKEKNIERMKKKGREEEKREREREWAQEKSSAINFTSSHLQVYNGWCFQQKEKKETNEKRKREQ